MSKIYLPHAEQFDIIKEHLRTIANALSMDMDISTWEGIQKAVRVGVAPDLIPVGTQLTVNHSVYGDMLFDVVAHNHYKSAYDENAHTMTLMSHKVIEKVQYDSPEAFYYAEAELPAGTYNFTIATTLSSWAAGTYQFTLTQALPIYGQLCISGQATTTLLSLQVNAYKDKQSTTATESVAITLGNSGTSLGTFGVELNHANRVSYGSNNYKESAIHQFLNGKGDAGSVWIPQTKFDRPPSWVATLAGFMNGLDSDFLTRVGEVVVPCAANNMYESPDSTTMKGGKYNIRANFYLPSQKEIFGATSEIVVDDSVQFPYYKDAISANRIKYKDSTPSYWWTRSAYRENGYTTRVVLSEGNMGGNGSHGTIGCVPVCTIV